MTENLPATRAFVLPDPATYSIARAEQDAAQALEWIQNSDDPVYLADLAVQIEMIAGYVATEDAKWATPLIAAQRLTEVKLGHVLPSQQGKRSDLPKFDIPEELRVREREVRRMLGRNALTQFRKLAEHAHEPEVREQIEAGASRRAVLRLCSTSVPRGTSESSTRKMTPQTAPDNAAKVASEKVEPTKEMSPQEALAAIHRALAIIEHASLTDDQKHAALGLADRLRKAAGIRDAPSAVRRPKASAAKVKPSSTESVGEHDCQRNRSAPYKGEGGGILRKCKVCGKVL